MTQEKLGLGQLIINPEYENLVPPISKQDFEELCKSIATDGLFESIWINSNGIILDGHHRYKAFTTLGKDANTIPTRIKDFTDPLDERKFVIECNLRRRHLQIHERAMLTNELLKIEQEKAKQRQEQGRPKTDWKNLLENNLGKKKSPTSRKDTRTNRKRTRVNKSSERAAKKLNLSGETLRKYQYIEKFGDKELVENMKKGWIKIHKAYKTLKNKEHQEEIIRQLKENQEAENKLNTFLFCGDFRTPENSSKIEDNSVNLIFTDPPYNRESLPVYKDLMRFAEAKLKPGGSLITFAGHYALPEIFEYMKSDILQFWWILCVKHMGGKTKMWKQGIFVNWKPLLWFVKGDKPNIAAVATQGINDYIESIPPDKSLHAKGWEQSTVEAEWMINYLTTEGQLVVDPFLGSGTFGKAALRLGRNFIGYEIDTDEFNKAKANLQEDVRTML